MKGIVCCLDVYDVECLRVAFCAFDYLCIWMVHMFILLCTYIHTAMFDNINVVIHGNDLGRFSAYNT